MLAVPADDQSALVLNAENPRRKPGARCLQRANVFGYATDKWPTPSTRRQIVKVDPRFLPIVAAASRHTST